MGNNELGINSFSGPMGQKEPAYGAVERLKTLTKLAPVGSPQAENAPRRAKQAGLKGRRASAPQEARATATLPDAPQQAQPAPQEPPYQEQVQQFWMQLAAEPGASEQVKQYAAEAAGSA